MNIHKILLFTILNLLLCLFALIPLSEGNIPTAHAQVAGFLGTIYYGTTTINAVFDHEFPTADGDPANAFTRHYDNQLHPGEAGFGYNGHNGIDYGLRYRPVRAGTTGDIASAGWENPGNHQTGLGLRVKVDHNNNYRTEYGHLSAVIVQTGDSIPYYGDGWSKIIGISGNTGNVFEAGCDPSTNVLCGAHLHFTLRDPFGIAINPYGWISPEDDPWQEIHNPGRAISFNAWDFPPWSPDLGPSVTTNQYGASGPAPLLDLTGEEAIIDDSGSNFIAGSNWISTSAEDGYLGNIHYANVISSGSDSMAKWIIHPPSYGWRHHVFVHIPTPTPVDPPPSINASNHAFYTIKSIDGNINQAIVVQSAYPNGSVVNGWAYLGTYQFALSGDQFIKLSRLGHNTNQHMVADAVKLIRVEETPTGCPIGQPQLSSSYSWSVAGDGDGRIKLIWDNGNPDYSFNVYRNLTNDTSNWTMIHGDENAISGEWVDTTVTNNTTYYYWLEIYDDCDEFLEFLGPQTAVSTPPPTPTPIPNLPPPPTGLTAIYNGYVPTAAQQSIITGRVLRPVDSVTLAWQNPISKFSISYNVYRSDSAIVPTDAAHRIRSNVTGTSYIDKGGQPSHYYVITAVNDNGESGASNVATAGCSDC